MTNPLPTLEKIPWYTLIISDQYWLHDRTLVFRDFKRLFWQGAAFRSCGGTVLPSAWPEGLLLNSTFRSVNPQKSRIVFKCSIWQTWSKRRKSIDAQRVVSPKNFSKWLGTIHFWQAPTTRATWLALGHAQLTPIKRELHFAALALSKSDFSVLKLLSKKITPASAIQALVSAQLNWGESHLANGCKWGLEKTRCLRKSSMMSLVLATFESQRFCWMCRQAAVKETFEPKNL